MGGHCTVQGLGATVASSVNTARCRSGRSWQRREVCWPGMPPRWIVQSRDDFSEFQPIPCKVCCSILTLDSRYAAVRQNSDVFRASLGDSLTMDITIMRTVCTCPGPPSAYIYALPIFAAVAEKFRLYSLASKLHFSRVSLSAECTQGLLQ
jgi:hypothetical protein